MSDFLPPMIITGAVLGGLSCYYWNGNKLTDCIVIETSEDVSEK